ncbi:Serine/threonine-protein kinase PrkC [Thalassoglobus neptunius]|uniref:non-specific serine/threonine protein kinase n=1 Tax=Thalassoglobus neptunius TaxID=1938619 RepID=A0A5C5VT60_9PLAN|nr:protein kinase [Thalassoglobus neptunius]TWT41297.1 Serine/threonine-protein kinase PrkC [Thalassoglobus neptunius]
MNQQVCDPNRLSSFVRGELSDQAVRELTSHLDECESCGLALEQQVAEASAWREASVFLGESVAQEHEAEYSVAPSRDAQIELVLSQLSPTDDPESLGRIAGLEVTGVVGSGGMGVVLKAHDQSLDRVVAVKVMAPHLAASGSARQRFAREAKAAAAVLHPNVIAIHGVSNEQALPYLVMPYVGGESLQKRIDVQGPLPLVDILRIGAQVAAGLAAAHEQGLVHRDIKPGNILMEQGIERVTITDFGLARAVDDASMTRSGVIAGTPQYMSPEQARGEPIDARSDLFSLGSLLYAICTGHSPFRAETSFGVMHRIMQDSPRPITEINPEIPIWLEGIVLKLLSKDAGDRFESAGEVAELLEGCLSHTQQPATTPLPEPVPELTSKPPRNRWWSKFIAAGVLLPLLLLAGVLIVLELNKGTLRIESEADDVPIRIVQGKDLVEELTVSKFGKSVRVAAGNYKIEIGGQIDGLALDDGSVTLQRGGNDVVRIVKVAPVTSALGDWPYGRLLKNLQEIKPPGGTPVTGPGYPISVSIGAELTRRLEAVPDGELDKWIAELERVTGDKLDGETARQACRTYIVNRMSVLFDDGDWHTEMASRLFKHLQSLTPSEVNAWKKAFESLFDETIGQNDKEGFNGGPSYALPLVLISVESLINDETNELSSGTTDLSLAYGLTTASVVSNSAVKYRERLAQLSKQDIASWRSKVDRFGGTKLDAAMNIILLDDYFVNETFQDGDFAATLGGNNPKLSAEQVTDSGGDTEDQSTNQSSTSPRRKAVNNLTRIAHALHRYHELHGHFPPAIILGKDGKGGPPHSWRVELLPLLGHGGLYDRYNFKEAWDTQRNLAVLAQIPDVYRSPLDQGNSTNTSYFGVVSDDISTRAAQLQKMREQWEAASGAGILKDEPEYEQYTPEATVFWKQSGASFIDMLDGTSNCIAVIEAKRNIPWTKPEDIEYSADQPLPKFGGWFEQGVHAAFADGTVQFLANYNDDQTIRNLLTISDGQPVEPLLVRRLRIHGAVAVSADEPEVAVGPEIYRVPDGLLLRVLPDQRSIITEADIAEVAVTTNPNNPSAGDIVAMTLTEEAGKRFLKATSRLSEQNLNGYMLITLDRKVLIAPRVLSPIANRLTITGDIDAKALAEEIQVAMKDLELGETSPPVMGKETLAPVEEVSQLNDEDGSFVTVTLPLKWHSEAALKQHLGQRHLTLLAEGVVMDDERSNAVNRVQRSVLHDCRLVSYKLIKRDGVEYWQSRLFVPHKAEYSIGALWYSDPIRTLRIGDRHTPVPADTLTQDDPQATLDKELQNGFQLRLDDSTDGKPGLSFDAASAERASAGGTDVDADAFSKLAAMQDWVIAWDSQMPSDRASSGRRYALLRGFANGRIVAVHGEDAPLVETRIAPTEIEALLKELATLGTKRNAQASDSNLLKELTRPSSPQSDDPLPRVLHANIGNRLTVVYEGSHYDMMSFQATAPIVPAEVDHRKVAELSDEVRQRLMQLVYRARLGGFEECIAFANAQLRARYPDTPVELKASNITQVYSPRDESIEVIFLLELTKNLSALREASSKFGTNVTGRGLLSVACTSATKHPPNSGAVTQPRSDHEKSTILMRSSCLAHHPRCGL